MWGQVLIAVHQANLINRRFSICLSRRLEYGSRHTIGIINLDYGLPCTDNRDRDIFNDVRCFETTSRYRGKMRRQLFSRLQSIKEDGRWKKLIPPATPDLIIVTWRARRSSTLASRIQPANKHGTPKQRGKIDPKLVKTQQLVSAESVSGATTVDSDGICTANGSLIMEMTEHCTHRSIGNSGETSPQAFC